MKISLKDQAKISPALPMQCAATFTGSALPLEFVDIPGEIGGAAVVAVAATVTNADGAAATAPCEHAGGVWRVTFAASCFEHYGFVERGVSVALTLRDGSGNERGMVLAVGDLEVKRSSPSAAPGDPEKSYQIKGEDIFVKTRVIDDVQHYARQEMSYDAEMGAWGADWLGDYILVDGEFVPFQAAGGTAATVATALLALLLVPFSAFGITATKEYVDRRDGEIAQAATNYTDSAIAEIPAPDFSPSNATLVATIEATSPAPGDYATVSNKAMTALQSFTEADPTVPTWAKSATQPLPPDYANVSNLAVDAVHKRGAETIYGEKTFNDGVRLCEVGGSGNITTLFDYAIIHNDNYIRYPEADGTLALESTIAAAATAATNYTDSATNALAQSSAAAFMPASFTETDPTVSSWAKQPTKPTYTAEEVGATTAADVYRLVAGTNVVLVVTNYNSATHAASMKLQHLDPESGQYVTYWDEMRQHGITYTNGMNYTDAAIAERAAPRAWSGTTSGLGSEAPAGVTWISTPETVIAGGFEYEKVVTSAGAVWVLTSNGMSTGATSNSFFRVAASDGTELFSIEKTDSYLIGVNADGITRSGNTVTIPINVVAAEHPYIRCTKNLVNPTWVKEDEGGLDCAWATVSWSGTTGAYVATVTTAEPQAFFYFEYMVEGQVKIKNSAKTEMSGGILFNGTTYLPTVNGNKLEFVAQ